jgi:riboflavin synthase
LLIEKGSICVNGVSLTAFNVSDDRFTVAIIPYTFANTNFKNLQEKDVVNLEFDILGKYVQRMLRLKQAQ